MTPELNFEEALKELELIVRRLEEGKTSLEDAIQAYERGLSLKEICERKLKEARLKVEQIVPTPEGTQIKPLEMTPLSQI